LTSKQIQKFKETEIGRIPSEWKISKIGENLSLLRDGSHNPPSRASFGVPFISGASSVTYLDIDFSKSTFIKEEDYKKIHRKYEAQENDILLTIIATVGNTAIVKKSDLPFSFQRNIALLRPNEKIHYLFLFYWLNSPQFKQIINSWLARTVQLPLFLGTLSEMPIPIPTFNEQKRIVEILFSIDKKIILLRTINNNLERIIQSIFKSMFIDFDRQTEFIDSELGEIPKEWKIVPLKDILQIQIGGDWGDENTFPNSCQVTCLRGTDFDDLKNNGYASNAPKRWIKSSSLEKRKLTDRDILLATSGIGPIGKTIYFHKEINSLYENDIMYTNFSKCLRAENKENAIYAEKCLELMYKSGNIFQFVIGTSIPNFDTNSLLESLIILPPRGLLKQFSMISDCYYKSLYNKQKLVLISIRNYLLPKLMSGEIRV